MEHRYDLQRCGFDRRYEDDRRVRYNVMPLGYEKRKKKMERRSPLERRVGWVRHTRWGSVGPERRAVFGRCDALE